jgi:type IV pilus assembly protein PilA
MRLQRGFSLLELLIVVAVILIIAAIAIPNLLQARIAANEASAVGSVSAIRSAQVTYFNTYPTVGYAAVLGNLGGVGPCSPTSSAACLLDNGLATATPGSGGKSGYVFQTTGIITGGATNNTSYVTGAVPLSWSRSGNRDFCSMNEGVMRSQLGATGDVPATALATCLAFPVSQ